MYHHSRPTPVTIGTTLAASDAIQIDDAVIGEVENPSGSSITQLTWYTSMDNTTYCLAADVGTSGVTSLAAGNAMQLPVQLVGAGFVKAIGDNAGKIRVNLKD